MTEETKLISSGINERNSEEIKLISLVINERNSIGVDNPADIRYAEDRLNRLIDFIVKYGWVEGCRNSMAVDLGIIAIAVGMESGKPMQDLINEVLYKVGRPSIGWADENESPFNYPAERIYKVMEYADNWIRQSNFSVKTAMIRYGNIPINRKSYHGEKYVRIIRSDIK